MALNYSGSYNLMRFPGFKYKALTLSYDDGLKNDAHLIEIMVKYGLKGTFNLNSGFMLKGENRERYLSPEEAYNLYTSTGMEVAAHGSLHLPVDKVDTATAVADLICDRCELEKMFKTVIKGLAYPLGTVNSQSPELAKRCGFSYARTINHTEAFDLPTNWLMWDPTTRHASPRFLELTEEFLNLQESKYFWFNEPKVFYTWGHTFEFDNDKDWAKIEDFARLVGSADDIWHATNIEIYEYVRAFNRLEFGAEGAYVYNPSAIDVYIKWINNKNVVIHAGKTVEL